MKKFQSLGKSLTKDEQKKIIGGDEAVDPIDDGGGACRKSGETCSTNKPCCSGLTCSGCTDTGYECS